jgi:hypothetical protein
MERGYKIWRVLGGSRMGIIGDFLFFNNKKEEGRANVFVNIIGSKFSSNPHLLARMYI